MANDKQPFTAGRFALMLDGGKMAGFLKKIEGGAIKADVVTEAAGPDNYIYKHIAGPQYDDITVMVGLSMSKGFYDWVQSSWDKNPLAKNGNIVALDSKSLSIASRDFYDALITEIGIPAMDASGKDPAYMTIKWKPRITRYVKGTGAPVKADFPAVQKTWLPSNFQFTMGDLDTTHVSKIDAITIKQAVAKHDVGEQRDATIHPGKLEYPDLSIMLSLASADPWFRWADEFIIKGNNGQSFEKAGHIEFRSPDQKPMGRIELSGCGIKSISEESHEAGAEGISKVKVELYCEQMKLVPDTNAMKA